MTSVLLDLIASILGLFTGTLLFSRVGHWLQAVVTAVKASNAERVPTAAALTVLSSGPWLLGGVIFLGYYALSGAHARAWDWFFASIAIALAAWLLYALYLHRRGKRNAALLASHGAKKREQ